MMIPSAHVQVPMRPTQDYLCLFFVEDAVDKTLLVNTVDVYLGIYIF